MLLHEFFNATTALVCDGVPPPVKLPVIHADICTGCGLCERACITEKAAVYILPRDVALGRVGTDYIKGWEPEDEQRLQGVAQPQQMPVERGSQGALEYLNKVEDDER